MEGIPEKKFSSPEEEIAYLRGEVARRERDLLDRNKEVDATDVETLGKEAVREYAEHDPSAVLTKQHTLSGEELHQSVESLSTSAHKVAEVLALAEEKGIRNALTVLEKFNDAYLTDEVHRALVHELHGGKRIADLKEGMPLFRVLDMTLYEVALPDHVGEHEKLNLSVLMSAMEQFYAGMQTIGGSSPAHYTLEIAVSDKRDDIIFYVAVPTEFVNLFEKQILSLFPSAVLIEQKNDYNIFVENGTHLVSVAKQKRHPVYPLRAPEEFEKDPLDVLLNAFSKIEREGGGASLQMVVHVGGEKYYSSYEGIIRRIKQGIKTDVAIRKSTIGGELVESMKDMFKSKKKESESGSMAQEIDTDAIELFGQKIDSPITATNIRIAVSARNENRAKQVLNEIESSFHQFERTKGNAVTFRQLGGIEKRRELKAFSFREYVKARALPLSFSEMATLMHFPAEGVESSPQFKQSRSKRAPAPVNISEQGTLLGENEFRNQKKPVYLTPEDRLRHFYVIGQTGTGKTVLIKNMIIQDILEGSGVCMIDPHGTDIRDVLSAVPKARWDDVVYFDPSRMDPVMGLNMLEYDPQFPEQKTFVVNELFSIFQKLYGAVPESMGPMFEQYFRNATQLVLEDPASGSTLLDVSRVMVDAAYRREKLKKSKNPVVNQFWREIATKAGGEAALENIVPYITSKFDVFTANDYMRPIIGQQRSSFNFRDIMDNKKILLVNLSKGRLGEINANLIGMILVGKILMAALSRVDQAAGAFPPFYLYIDEFQNVTTDSIASILSEARKYKLGLTIAHQFVAQIDERIRDAVFGNVGSLCAFRVGPEDADFLAHQFEPVFDANDLMNIENWNGYVRLLSNGTPTKPFSIHTMAPAEVDNERAEQLISYTFERNGVPRRKVEMDIQARYQL